MTELTIEQLQEKVLELSQKNEQLETENASLKKTNEEVSDTIKQVRAINTKLYQQSSFGITNTNPSAEPEQEEHVETKEEFLKSFIDPAKERLSKTYGVEFT